jgi:hypothetical protein
MPAPDPLAPFLEPLERLGIPYCITGSVATSVYGEPRLTADIDLVVLLKPDDISALRQAFSDSDYYVPPDETLRKLESLHEGGSDKHVRDIRFVLAATAVDRAFLHGEIERRDLRAEWSRCHDDTR